MWGIALAFLSWLGYNPTPWFASLIGTTEPAIKLLLSILAAYPIAIIYHKHVKKFKELRDLYFIGTGIDIAIYNFGLSMYHNLIPALVLYGSTYFLGATKENVIVTFVFNMAYLLTGYVLTESEDYDITWTMPQCVLTLKLIALSFDLWDGSKKRNGETLSKNQKENALEQSPRFTELMGFVYFPSCFLVGPIFSFRRYTDFVSDKFPLETNEKEYERQAIRRLLQGVIYLASFQIGVSVFNIQYMLSDDFWKHSIFYRHIYCGLWAHFALYKYISCWLLTEASCIRFGLSYNGTEKTPEGHSVTKWDGCNNIKLMTFESATKFQHYIESFNCNTNHFAAEYIYKRLKFLGNRHLSQFFTLMFLALWHGTRSGYYMTFLNEFLIIFMERDLENMLNKTEIYHKIWSNKLASYALYVLLKSYTIIFMGWSLVPFDVKVFSKWMYIYSSLYFSGLILFGPWGLLYRTLVNKMLKNLNRENTQ